jgi:succinyl-diaminopimelate desuccinylase
VNYRFAPDRDLSEATAHLREVFAGFEVTVVDGAPGARPGLDAAPAQEFVEVVGATPEPKFGWTDVARFSAAGTPALNFGPGDPSLAHTEAEHVSVQQIRWCAETLTQWLRGSATPPA